MERIARLLGAETEWERPGPDPGTNSADARLAVGWFLVAAVGLELLRGVGALPDDSHPLLQQLAIGSAALLLLWRRRHPLVVASLASVHMFVVGMLMSAVMASLPMQVLYFFALFSGVAWARDRRLLSYVVVGVFTLMFCWLAWQFALGSGVSEIRESLGDQQPDQGVLPALPSALGYTFLVNAVYFGGAVGLGQLAWQSARRHAQVEAQAATIREQADRLRDQAVVAERLRIARELHDVVAHHVSVMGVQAAGARRVLDRDPAVAGESLAAIEASSREAVHQMRDLLGTLRNDDETPSVVPGEPGGAEAPRPSRAPEPGLSDVPALVEQARSPGRDVEYSLVQDESGGAAAVPAPLQLTAYRVIQEALANTRRHSTARKVSVTVRTGDQVEVEVVDDGHPRPGSSGGGLGLVGIRERAQILGGTVEIGPRHGDGFRVRVALPVALDRTSRSVEP